MSYNGHEIFATSLMIAWKGAQKIDYTYVQ